MSKAFTRESDDVPERATLWRTGAMAGGDGVRRMTAAGLRRLREERERLRSEPAGEQAQARDVRLARIEDLERLLTSSMVVTPVVAGDRVGFGATVTVRGRNREESRYRLVGPDEVGLEEHWVNWRSPLARALLDARVGDRVRVRLPSGEEECEIMNLRFEM